MTWLKNLLSPFKIYLVIAGVILFALLIWEATRVWAQSNDDVKAKADLAEAIKNCRANSTFTEDNTHALDSRISDINGYANSLQQTTIVQPAKPSGQHDGATKPNQPSGCTIEQRKLNDIQASQLVSCQATVCYIYQANGQEDLLPKGRCQAD